MNREDTENLEKLVAITTAIISVFLAISSILGNQAGGDSTSNLIQANDQWSFYQAKSIKQNVYDVNKNMLEVELSNPNNPKAYNDALKLKITDFNNTVNRYNKEKLDIQNNATMFSQLSQADNDKSNVYNYANGIYQISIILAAIALLAKRRYMWVLSLSLGIIGLGFSLFAFFMP